jgi:plasmid stabilization system protein ParE
LNLISEQPEAGRSTTAFKKIRFVTIDKRYRMFYRVKPTDINILTFFDTKQDPSKSPY